MNGPGYHVSTATLDGAPAFVHWHAEVQAHVTPIDIRVPDRAAFRGELRKQHIGDVQFSVISAASQQGVHDASGRHGASPRFDLVYMRSGGITLRQNGREATLGAGEALLFSHLDNFSFVTSAFSEAYLVALPSAWVERWLPDPYACTIRPLVGTSPWGAAIDGLLHSVAHAVEEGRPLPAHLIADQLGGCLALMCDGLAGEETTHRRRLLHQIRRTLSSRFADPDLTPAAIAAQHGISVRYLHSLFAATGSSAGRELRMIRLARVRAMLEDSGCRNLTVSEIAYACGFNDPGYLARCFAQEFGRPPTSFRNG
ncbi:helix-turn-helix domain-containing protein [Sphingomonadales bacterium 56]|uniref:AraC-like ligand-binding domain-containing protein n=1 Tax=Sphingobium sp. S6 TaxID=2758386 RepID=UPI001919AD60|nr:helix-turn-helix domain-containing protein [Sphingobium sp. S6]MBY2929775.1 helix-turn-helix domain-containing protein [Sphingomonadales bacterium 56]CAD7340119.1 Transcriptional activator NphR [Sphingobium sp. S6]